MLIGRDDGGKAGWRDGGMGERRDGGMVERRDGRMAKWGNAWQNGRVVGWWDGRKAGWRGVVESLRVMLDTHSRTSFVFRRHLNKSMKKLINEKQLAKFEDQMSNYN